MAARSVEGKVTAIVFPIAAFVALGFEHCVANLYLLPVGMLSGANLTLAGFLANIVPVTLGNTVGGAGFAVAYWLVYLSDASAVDTRLGVVLTSAKLTGLASSGGGGRLPGRSEVSRCTCLSGAK